VTNFAAHDIFFFGHRYELLSQFCLQWGEFASNSSLGFAFHFFLYAFLSFEVSTEQLLAALGETTTFIPRLLATLATFGFWIWIRYP